LFETTEMFCKICVIFVDFGWI